MLLLLSFETHHDALLKILSKSYVHNGIATQDLKQIVGKLLE